MHSHAPKQHEEFLFSHLYSKSMLFSGARPTQARKIFSNIARCFAKALTHGVPRGTNGALVRYDRSTAMGWKPWNSSPSLRSSMRVMSSAKSTKSRIKGAASSESSQVLCMTIVLVPPMKIWLVYSSIARFESPTVGMYLITMQWSGCSPGLYRRPFDSTMSFTTSDLEISFERKHMGAERFLPSLFPRWLYETMDVGLKPAPTRKSTNTDFILVCPLLKSSPPISTLCFSASSTTPGTKVFWGDPLMKGTPSKMQATAKSVDGAISFSLSSMARK